MPRPLFMRRPSQIEDTPTAWVARPTRDTLRLARSKDLDPDMAARSPHRDALRVLYILVRGAEPPREHVDPAIGSVFYGEARLHAFDFWVRNPDYLIEELIDLYESSGDERYIRSADAILGADEPDIRRVPMVRYKFGAYERIDNTLSLLRSRDLIRISRKIAGGRVRETDFQITQAAASLADEIIKSFPILEWYSKRAALVTEVAQGRGGDALKKRQYEQLEYAETQLGKTIPSILDRVKTRLRLLQA